MKTLLLWMLCTIASLFSIANSPEDPPELFALEIASVTSENEEVLAALNSALSTVFGDGKFEVGEFSADDNDNGGKDISASIALFSKPDVSLGGSYANKRLSSLEVEFPEESSLDFNLIDNLVGGSLKTYLPDSFPMSAGVWVKQLGVEFGPTSYVPSSLSASISSPSSWELLGAGSFSAEGVELEFEASDPTKASRELTGTLSATASMGEIPMSISTTLSNNSENTAITASVEKVNLKNILDATLGSSSNALLSETPDLFKALELSKVELAIMPFDKSLNFQGETSLGGVIVDVNRSGGSNKTLFALKPPDNPEEFKFSDLAPILTPLDGLDMSGSYFILTDKQSTIPAKFLDPEAGDEEFKVKAGLNLVTSIKLPDEFKEMLKIESVTLVGSMPKNFSGVKLRAELGLDLKLGDSFSFDNLNASLTLDKSEIEFGFGGAGSFQAGDDRVELYGGLFLSLTDQTIEFEAGLAAGGTAAEKPESCIVPQAEWSEPFGVPGVGIRALGMRAGIGAKFPWINTVGLTGNMRFGTVSDQSKHICGELTAYVNVADPTESMLIAEVRNITPLGFIEAFSDTEISGTLRDALDTGIESGKLKVVPKEMELFGRTYSQGIALDSARLKLAGLEGLMGFSFGTGGISAYGQFDPYSIEAGEFTVFEIAGSRPGANGEKVGPTVSLGLDASNPHIKLNGKVTVLEITREAFIEVDKNGFEFETKGNILNGALAVSATIKAGELSSGSGMYASVTFENKLQTMVADELLKFIEDESKKSQEAYKNAKKVLAETKTNNDFEQFWVDAASETVNAFQELDKGAAVAGAYVVEGLLKDALNVRKLHFGGEVSTMGGSVELEIDMTIAGSELKEKVKVSLMLDEDAFVDFIVDAIGEEVIDFFGTLDTELVSAFEDLGDELETAFEDLGNYIVEGAEIVGEGVITAAEYVGDAIIEAAEATEEWFMGSNETNEVSRGTFAGIPPDHTHVQVTIHNITVIQDEADVGADILGAFGGSDKDGLELYGGIIIITSPFVKTNAGATPYAYSRSARNSTSAIDEGRSINVGHTKDFFVPNNQSGFIQIISAIGEWNTVNTDTEMLSGVGTMSFNGLTPGETYNRSFTGFNDSGVDEEIRIDYTVNIVESRGPIPTKQQMLAAASRGNMNELVQLVRDGGKLRGSGMIEAAITGNAHHDVVLQLLREGNVAKTKQVELASDSRYKNKQTVKYLLSQGAYASSQSLLNAVSRNEMDMAKLMVAKKAYPKLEHIQMAVKNDNVEMINYLMSIANIQVGEAELQYAVNKGDVPLIKKFIDQGGTANAAMIAKAVTIGDADIVNALLRVGKADANALQAAANANNTTLFKTLVQNQVRLVDNKPIEIAINKKNYDIVEMSLRNGGSKAATLSYAIQRQDKTALRMALDAGANASHALEFAATDEQLFADLVNKYRAPAGTAVRVAYDKNSTKLAEHALKAGGNPNLKFAEAVKAKRNNWINLLLKYNADAQLGIDNAIANKDMPTTALLIENGANTRRGDHLASIVRSGNIDFVKLMVEKGESNAEHGRLAAIAENNVPIMAYLLEKGAQAKGIKTPSTNGWFEMVELLVSNGADANEGITEAINADQTKVAVYLLDEGADVGKHIETTATKGNEAITKKLIEKGANPVDGTFNAMRYKHTNIMEILIDAGADVSRPALMDGAVVNFDEAMILLLLKHDGDIQFVTKKEESYLHRVADKKGQSNLAKIFIDAGVAIDAKNNKGETALHLAVRSGKKNAESVRLLIEAGANVNAKTNSGKSVYKRSNNKAAKDLLKAAGAEK